jgi:predicted transposase/invertase (TIGR01784 family)
MKNQIYDKTFRTLFESSLKEGILLKKYQADIDKIEQLDTVSKRPKELRVDFAQKITPKSGKPYILHLEFQSKYSDDMPYRMLEYYEMLSRKNRLEVEQILVYVGNSRRENMEEGIKHKNLHFHYKILDLSKLSFQKLLASKSTNEIVMAILCNFKKQQPSDAIELILRRLQKNAKTDDELKDALYFLQILADLRKFGTDISKKLKAMPITLDYRKTTFYKEGRQQGMQEGRQEGKQEGKREGIEEGKQKQSEIIALELHKIGLELSQISHVTNLTMDYLKKLLKIEIS